MVGYYIGSFDMFTKAHRAPIVKALRGEFWLQDERGGRKPGFPLERVFTTINHATDKDFNASVWEREQMMRIALADLGDRVVLLKEPLEGRPAFARYLLARYPHEDSRILGVFGDDVREKNKGIFAGTTRFDHIYVERREVVTAQEAVYEPVEYSMVLDESTDGLSSSLGRRLYLEGKPTDRVLEDGVVAFMRANGLYPNLQGEELDAARIDYYRRWRKFVTDLRGVMPSLDLSRLPEPSFKPTQSKEAQHEKFVRYVADNITPGVKMPLDQQLFFRPLAEQLLGIRYLTRPMTWRAGVYFGSFDPPKPGQLDVAVAAIQQGRLDVLYVGMLEASGKPIERSQAERRRLFETMVAGLGAPLASKIVLVDAPALGETPKFVRELRNRQLEPLLTVFGDDVFPGNHGRLKDIWNLRFAVAPRAPGVPLTSTLPEDALVLSPGCPGATAAQAR